MVADAQEQRRQGVFPVYVGQSAFRWNGGSYPQAQAPGLSLLAVALDLLTLGRLGSAAVLNAVVLLCALAGALAMYLALRPLDEGQRWLSALGALLYVTCPGVLGVLMRLDMYTTLLALPLLPLLWRSLLAVLAGGPPREALALGLCLAALWSCHPPVALWATSAAALCALVFGPLRGLPWARLGLALGVLLLADAWHLTTVFSLGAQQASNVGLGRLPAAWVETILGNLRADLPGAFLPVGWTLGGPVNGWPSAGDEAAFLPESWRLRAGTPYLQLGYALWATLLLGVGAAAWGRDRSRLAPAAGALLLLVFLFPWPFVGAFAWSHLPAPYSITRLWPMQRFYILLASLAPFCGLPALARWRSAAKPVALSLAALWGLCEADKLASLAVRWRCEPAVTLLENTPLKRKDLQMGAPRTLPEFGDPALLLRLVSSDDPRSELSSNLAALAPQGPAAAWRTAQPRGAELTLATLTLTPGQRQAVSFRASPGVGLIAAGKGYWRRALEGPLPLWTSLPQPQVVDLRLRLPPGLPAAPIDLSVAPYRPEALPLALLSHVPLRVRLYTAAQGAALLTPRLFLPGYRASADGRALAVRASTDGYALVPLPDGAREVTLEYVGTPAMRAAFWLSALCWLGGLVAAARAGSGRRS